MSTRKASNTFDRGLGPTYTWAPMRSVVLSVAVALIPAVAFAQGEEGKSEEAPPAGDASIAPAGGGAKAPMVIDASKVSTPQKQKDVERMIPEQRSALRRITELLKEARSSKDIVQLNCVNEKLTQVKALVRISDEAATKMYEAIASSSEEIVNHEYTRVVVAHQKTMSLKADAEQCVGERSVFTGDTQIEVEIDPDITSVDPTQPTPPPPGPTTPPVASRK